MTHSNRLEAAIARVDELNADLIAARAEKTIAVSAHGAAKSADKAEAAAVRAAAETRVSELTAALQKAKDEVQAAKKAAKTKKKTEATAAMADRAGDDPLSLPDVHWGAIGKWLAIRAKDRVCFVEGAGWGEWTGTHWEFSTKPSASLQDRVRATWANIVSPVTDKLNAGPKSALYALDHAQGALTLPRAIFNSREVAHLVAFRNTTVDLRTGARVPHAPQHYMTGALQCDYNEGADADRIGVVFGRFWPNDKETTRVFQMALGYSLTGETSAKRVMMMVGNQDDDLKNGDNGKSMVQNAMVRLFGLGQGGWGAAVKAGLVVDTGDRDANSHDGAKVPLIWRRFAMSSEMRRGASIDSGEFNRVSGGDVQTARPPHAERAVEFVNAATLWMAMNTPPRFKTWDKATRRRLTPFPFTETFYDPADCPKGGQMKELGLEQWLESQAGQEALALYAVRGAVAFYAHNSGKAGNLPDSKAMLTLRDRILQTSNPYADLFEDYFEFDQAWDTRQSAVHKIVRDVTGTTPKPYEKDLLVSALKGMGVSETKLKGERLYRGMRLTPAGMKVATLGANTNPCTQRGMVVPIAAE